MIALSSQRRRLGIRVCSIPLALILPISICLGAFVADGNSTPLKSVKNRSPLPKFTGANDPPVGPSIGIELISKADPKLVGDSASGESTVSTRAHSISRDGRFMAFVSDARNLVPEQSDDNEGTDVFLFDRTEGTIRLVSGVEGSRTRTGSGRSGSPVVSADGRFVAFHSQATDLVPNQTDLNNSNDVFVFDRVVGTTRLASGQAGSVTHAGDQGSEAPDISADGRFIAFQSNARDLVTGQTDTTANTVTDVFVFDRVAETVRLVSGVKGSAVKNADGPSSAPVMSDDGRFIAFQSLARDLVRKDKDGNKALDVFVFDRITGKIRLASGVEGDKKTTGNDGSRNPAISADGRFVAFVSEAGDLIAGQTGQLRFPQVFLFDRVEQRTRLVSGTSGSTTRTGNGRSESPTLSADGRFISFHSSATDLVEGLSDPNRDFDVFVFDRVEGKTKPVSHTDSSRTLMGSGMSENPTISRDGRYIAYESDSRNLVSGQQTRNGKNVFVYELATGLTRLASGTTGSPNLPGSGESTSPIISGDGQFVAFQSVARHLVPELRDANEAKDVFVSEHRNGKLIFVTKRDADLACLSANGNSRLPNFRHGAVSGDGRYLVFRSEAENLGMNSPTRGVFLHDRVAGTTRLVGETGNPPARTQGDVVLNINDSKESPVISADGRFIAFVGWEQNVVAGQQDNNGGGLDVFLFDQLTGTNRLVSGVSGSRTQTGNRESYSPVISADGRFIAFASDANDLVPGQPATFLTNVFVFDRVRETTRLISAVSGSTTRPGNGNSDNPVISADGNVIVFQSQANNLVPDQKDSAQSIDVFVFEQATGTIRLVSKAAESPSQTEGGYFSTVSADGRFIAFASYGNGLIVGQERGATILNVFVFDRLEGTMELVSRVAESKTRPGDGNSRTPVISPDGNFIAFASSSSNLIAGQQGPSSPYDNIFLFDRKTGAMHLVSASATSRTHVGDNDSNSPTISADGRFVAFQSESADLVPGQRGQNEDDPENIFLFDRITETTRLISGAKGSAVQTGNNSALSPVISADGRFVAFTSKASNLTARDYNNRSDVFMAEIR